ncbi:hypothetical protein [Bradyrhizobium sp. CCBAU 51745]|uniref:hypothetical protein n=1 Tax=Bradyrhizobium sp. CCBAU 51745 TaxID=1325099 RepID=UPI00230640E0|nr:hypothetical protein [Bradyrhizobium sp. CCBAU 51745]
MKPSRLRQPLASDGADARAENCTAKYEHGHRTFVAVRRKFSYSALLGKNSLAYDRYRRNALTPDVEHRDSRKLSFSLTAAAVNMIGPTIAQIETSMSTLEAKVECEPSVISIVARPRLTKAGLKDDLNLITTPTKIEIREGSLPARSTLRITEAGTASDHSPAIALGDILR